MFGQSRHLLLALTVVGLAGVVFAAAACGGGERPDAPADRGAAAAASAGAAAGQPAAQEQAQPPPQAPAAPAGDAARGAQLFLNNGCAVCHGDQGQGLIGPTIAQTRFTIEQVLSQYRKPRLLMPPFPEALVPDADVADIYAWLHTLPIPATIVPGEGSP